MITKGVASVRSPVQNLQRFDPSISHESFVDATVDAFKGKYDIDEEVRAISERILMRPYQVHLKIHYVEENDNILNVPAICTGMDELKVRLTSNMVLLNPYLLCRAGIGCMVKHLSSHTLCLDSSTGERL